MNRDKGKGRRAVLVILLAAAAVAALPAAARADEITLEEAVNGALARNHALAAKGYAHRAAVWAHRQAKAQLLPSLSVRSSYTRLDDETVRRANAIGREITMFFPDSTGQLQPFTIEIPQTVFRHGYESSVDGQLLLFQPAVWNGVSLAGASKDAAYWDREAARLETVHATVTAYLDLLRTDALLDLRERNLLQARENLALAERLFRVGRYAEADVLRWRVEEARQSGLLAEQRSGRRVAALALEVRLGADPMGAVDPDTTLPALLAERIGSFRGMTTEEWERFLSRPLAEVIAGDPRLRMLEQSRRLADIRHRQSVTNFLPSVTVSGSYGWQNNESPELDGEKAWYATAALNLPIFTGFSNLSEHRMTRAQARQAREETEESKRALLLSAETARTSIRSAAERLRAAEAALASARRNREIQRNSFALGRLTNLEWIDANLALQEAEGSYTTAYYDLVSAVADYHHAAGDLLGLLNS
ncbi:MAG: TolC family protein [Candidatus Eisenbacteria bacterium]|nr:TolC family protein [Candidatus Eisenbacteria bacterium]